MFRSFNVECPLCEGHFTAHAPAPITGPGMTADNSPPLDWDAVPAEPATDQGAQGDEEPITPRPALVAFTIAMEKRLRLNDHKPDWAPYPWWGVERLLHEEVEELRDELWNAQHIGNHNIPAEAEDVAICAFIAWDKAQERPSQDRGRTLP